MSQAKRRRTDRGWHRLIRENAYRDAWLLIVSGCVLLAIIISTHQASRANELAHAFQQQRLTSIYESCQAQNARHDATDRKLKGFPPKLQQFAGPLIDTIAPHRDCKLVVQQAQQATLKPKTRRQGTNG